MNTFNDTYKASVRLTEGRKTKSGLPEITGIFAVAEKINNNQRRYPRNVLMGAVSKLIPELNKGSVLGALNHQENTGTKPPADKIAIKVTSLVWEGNNLIGRAQVLPTQAGRDLYALLKSGVRVGISSCGRGSLTDCGDYKEVGADYEIVSFDAVVDPSTAQYLALEEARKVSTSAALKLADAVEGQYTKRKDFLNQKLEETLQAMEAEEKANPDKDPYTSELLDEFTTALIKSAVWEATGRKQLLDTAVDQTINDIREAAITSIQNNDTKKAKRQLARIDHINKVRGK